MKTVRNVAALAAVLGMASVSSAAITVADYWRMGEANSPVPANDEVVTTITQTTGAAALLASPPAAPTPSGVKFSTDVPSDPAAGSTLSVSLGGNPNDLVEDAVGISFPSTTVDNFGIEAWVNPAAVASGNQAVFSVGSTATRISLRLNGTGANLRYQGTSPDIAWTGLDGLGYAANTWTHLALVRNNGITSLYVNGVAATTASDTTKVPGSGGGGQTFRVGSAGDAAGFPNYFTGKIDELRLFTFAPGEFSTSDLLVTVPEPTTLGLVGLAGLGLIRRRRHS